MLLLVEREKSRRSPRLRKDASLARRNISEENWTGCKSAGNPQCPRENEADESQRATIALQKEGKKKEREKEEKSMSDSVRKSRANGHRDGRQM